MRLVPIVALSLWLTACGDDDAGPSASGSGAVPGMPGARGGTSKPLMPSELADAMKRAGGDPEAMSRDLEAALKAQMGPTFVEDARKAKALGERPLTAADVETYIALAPQMGTAAKDPAAWRETLASHGLSQPEWGVLMGRMMQMRMLMRMPSDKVDAKLKADVETVRPHQARIDAASKVR